MHYFRPHHLLCVLNYIGKGYSDDFIRNYDDIVAKINAGQRDIEIVRGPDDICGPCLNESFCHCRDEHKHLEDVATLPELQSVTGLENLDFGSVFVLTDDIIQNLRAEFKAGRIRRGCQNCEWFDLCTDVSQSNYKGTKLK